MNMEGNLYRKHEEESADAARLAEALRQSESLKPESAEKIAVREEKRGQKAKAELERLQNASNDEGEEEIAKSSR